MFYAHIVLAKKGPFARIWLAAHWDKKLTKAHVFETNIEQSVEGIMQPKVKLALRTSGHLLLGVVRIYSRKAKYLLADCNEAFVKIKMAFRPGMVDLPEEHREAAVNAITLPEVFHDFDTALPELNDVDIEAQFSINQSRADEITMREDYGSIPMSIHDEGFGDMALDDIDFASHHDAIAIDENLIDDLDAAGRALSGGGGGFGDPQPGTSRSLLGSLDAHDDLGGNGGIDGFGGTGDIGDGFGEPANGLFEGDLFAEPPAEVLAPSVAAGGAAAAAAAAAGDGADDSDDDMDGGGGHWDDDHRGGGGSSGASSPIEFLATSPPPYKGLNNTSGAGADDQVAAAAAGLGGEAAAAAATAGAANDENDRNALNQSAIGDGDHDHAELPSAIALSADAEAADDPHAIDQTTLLHNEEESFALAPVDASALRGVTKAKRKRKLIVDEVKNISGEEMKSQLANTSDIITTLDLAPPTKRLMIWKDTGGVDKVFAQCSRDIRARVLFRNNQRHFQLRAHHLDDFSQLGPSDVLALDQYQQQEAEAAAAAAAAATAAGNRRGRKRKLAAIVESPPSAAAAQTPLAALDETSQAQAALDGASPAPDHHAHLLQVSDDRVRSFGSEAPLDFSDAALGGSASAAAALLRSSIAGEDALLQSAQMGARSPSMLLQAPAPLDDATMPSLCVADDPMLGLSAAQDDDEDGAHMDHGMTPNYSADYGGAADIQSPAYTPGYEGEMTPHHPMVEQLESIPNLRADQVQSILGDGAVAAGVGAAGGLSERVANDWTSDAEEPTAAEEAAAAAAATATTTAGRGDFDFPPEVATHQPGDEQLENETDEAFEERVLNKRAAQMFVSVRARMQTVDHMYLSEMTQRNNRKQAAQKFYSLLVLKKFRALDIQQDTSYGDILVTKGTMFDNPKL